MSYIGNLFTHNGKVGRIGENYAVEFLKSKGHRIVERNFKNKVGEIDIVTSTCDSNGNVKLHIVEVKTTQSEWVMAEENMNASKLRKVGKLAEMYINYAFSSGKVTRETHFCVDFIGIYLNKDNSLKEVKYIENLEV